MSYESLINMVRENPEDRSRWSVLADKLHGDDNFHGEALEIDLALRQGLVIAENQAAAREIVLQAREKIWKRYTGKESVPDYVIGEDDYWMGAFPLRLQKNDNLDQLDGAFTKGYDIFRANTYAAGVAELQRRCRAENNSAHPQFVKEDGSRIYRPLTFKETIEARVIAYESNRDSEEQLRLFQNWFDSCTAVAYKKGTTKFKIVHISPELITIPENFNRSYIAVKYDAISGIELDSNDAWYNTRLTSSRIEAHPAWLAALEDDTHLLKAYRDIVFAEIDADEVMAFWLRNEFTEDHLRALFVNLLNGNSYANGNYNLSGNGSFLRVAPSARVKNG